MRQAGEPSVEEILESIKKVIARDNRAEADQLRRRREAEGVVATRAIKPGELAADMASGMNGDFPDFDGDAPPPVLELTDAEMAPLDEGEAAGIGDDVDEQDFAEDDPDNAAANREAPDAPLLAETARASMAESLAALATLAEPGARPRIVRSGETSLEGLTRELLRPMLAEWLERNLPPLVEKLVAAEIARIAGKRG